MSLPTILMPTHASPSSTRTLRSTQPRLRPPPAAAAAELPPATPFDDNKNWKLFITTSSTIHTWDDKGCTPIFTSSSRGIVAAKRALDGSVLAIADAQVVVLHRIEDGQDKSYRLRGTQRCRLLQYSHDSRNLFYTNSLNNSVQSYSLADNRVADAARSHPSPVSAFAVSCDSNLIVSASANPPTIQIYNQLLTTTISLVPNVSAAPVVICAFHPSRKHFFLLAFGDGVLAAYDYTRFSGGKTAKKENSGLGMVRCHARAVHAFRHLHDPSIAGSAGITGAGFVPGHRSRAVTVGEDGRCFLIDFEKGDTLGSWHIGAPATGLAIRAIDASALGKKTERGGCFIAVGTVHGRCLVYDGNGNKAGERVIDADGESVLDVEWVCGDISVRESDAVSLENPVTMPSSPPQKPPPDRARRSRKPSEISGNAFKSLYDQDLNPTVSLPAPLQSTADPIPEEGGPSEISRRKHRAFSPPVYDTLEDVADQGYMNLFSPVKRKRISKAASLPAKKNENNTKPMDPRLRAANHGGADHRSVISAPQLWEEKDRGTDPSSSSGARTDPQAAPSSTTKHDAFTAFQQKETTGTEESPQLTHPSPDDASHTHPQLSTVTGSQIQVEEKTDDGRILSEIRSIRAMFSGKTKNSPEDSAASPSPPLPQPQKAKSTPTSKLGSPAGATLRRSASAPDTRAFSSNALPADDSPPSPPYQLPNIPEAPAEDIPTEDEAVDIWASMAIVPRPSRRTNLKRKTAPLDTSINAPTAPADRSAHSGSRSSKSVKTVSWSDHHHPNQPQQHRGGLADLFPTPAPPSSSVVCEFGGGSESLGRPLQPTTTSNNTTSNIDTNTATPGGGIDEVVRTALAEMAAQMRAMQVEMQRQFRVQHEELVGLRSDMGRVREENEKLRNMLFLSSGVRESVRRREGGAGGSSGGE